MSECNDTPLSDQNFAALMQAVGPFEPSPLVAVAVSGGRDSLALAWLTHRWAQACGGRAVGVTVDHGLRREAGEEAHQVGSWLGAWGMGHVCLRNEQPISQADIQAQARAVRYQLLDQWCRDQGCLHLLTAHHQQDQAETVMLRLGRGSGVQGLSAMAPVSYRRGMRLLRPLLSVPRSRLQGVLTAINHPWIDDPSNQNADFERVQWRTLLPELAERGLTPERLMRTATRLAAAADLCEGQSLAELTARLVPHPAGWAWLDLHQWSLVNQEVAARCLSGLLSAYGGYPYGPRSRRLETLMAALSAPGAGGTGTGGTLDHGVTLHGCRLRLGPCPEHRPGSPAGRGLLICREARHLGHKTLPADGQEILWDGRFRARFKVSSEEQILTHCTIGPLGENVSLGAGTLTFVNARLDQMGEKAAQKVLKKMVPGIARASLPALYEDGTVKAVPALRWAADERGARLLEQLDLRFSPQRAMAFVGLCLAAVGSRIISCQDQSHWQPYTEAWKPGC